MRHKGVTFFLVVAAVVSFAQRSKSEQFQGGIHPGVPASYGAGKGLTFKSDQLAKQDVPRQPDAQRLVTVAQLEEIVGEAKSQDDREAAKEIEHLQLTERLSSPKLAILTGELRGKKSKNALMAVADSSAFLNPPTVELSQRAAPDQAEQERIVSLAIDYVKNMTSKLPALYTTRVTTSFEDVWTPKEKGDTQMRGVLHSVGTFKATVYNRDGQEVVHNDGPPEHGLITRGTFGPILARVTQDAAHSATMQWSRWEEGPNKPMAVLTFQVPQLESHYAISESGGPGTMDVIAYHGEIGIDPGSGEILRLVLQGDPDSASAMRHADIMVEYGPIEIGGQIYTCPVHSISYSVGTIYVPVVLGTSWKREAVRLNDIVYSDYHVSPSSGTKWRGNAPRHVAIKDLRRILADNIGKPDENVARELSDLELTERVNYAGLESLKQSVAGPKSRSALIALADASVFLSSSVDDTSLTAVPDFKEQQRLIAKTVDYVGKTLPKLPDFFATETIARYEGNPRSGNSATAASDDDQTWRESGNSKVVVTYRDGKEVFDPREWGKHREHRGGKGLITRGLFGPILSTVILDAGHGEMIWDRWERGTAGKMAVFRYSVPQSQSHYAVAFHFRGGGEAERSTGYHGEIAIDPASGTILDLTVQADLRANSTILRGDIMVEYGPVEIGGKTYTCPLRSVSIAFDARGIQDAFGPYNLFNGLPQAPHAYLNDGTFGDYHLFRSNSRILTGTIPAPER